MNSWNWKRIRAARVALLASAAAILLAAGCSREQQAVGYDEWKGTVKYMAQKEAFNQEYGDLIGARFPGVEQEFWTQPEVKPGVHYINELVRALTEQQPDILRIYSVGQYERLVKEGLLMDLTPFIKKDRYDMEAFIPAVTDMLRAGEEGKLYGLAPDFKNQVLYYNKDLFDRYQVPYPTDGMSWEDVLRLAARFPQEGADDKRIYGYHQMYMFQPMDLVTRLARTAGISLADPEGRRVMIDSPAWRQVFATAVEAFRQGSVRKPVPRREADRIGKEETMDMDLFTAGRAAMALGDKWYLYLMNARGNSINTGTVKQPVDPSMPDASTDLTTGTIFAVGAGADNPALCWEIIKFVMSPEAARINAKTQIVPFLSTRKSQLNPGDAPFYDWAGYNDRFYSYDVKDEKITQAIDKLSDILNEELHPVLEGKAGLDEAIAKAKARGQSALDAAWKELKP